MLLDYAALAHWLDWHPVLAGLRAQAELAQEPCWLVGGAVRDGLLGRAPKDADFIYLYDPATHTGPTLPERLAAAFEAPCIHYEKDLSVERVVIEGTPYDFVRLPHAEALAADLWRRDFAWNAMALPLEVTGDAAAVEAALIDPTGGRTALLSREIRFTDPAVIAADPLRMLRAWRFACTLGFDLPADTQALIAEERHRFAQPSGERVRDELMLILAHPHGFATLQRLCDSGLLDVRFPAIAGMREVEQNGYHHLPVYEHSLECVRQVEVLLESVPEWLEEFAPEIVSLREESFVPGRPRKALLKLALLFHDLGKPGTRTLRPDGVYTFIGHDRLSVELMRPYLQDLHLSVREIGYLEAMVREHLRPGFLDLDSPTLLRSLHRYFVELEDWGVDLALLSIADRLAAQGPMCEERHNARHRGIVQRICRAYWRETALVVRPPDLITGGDLLQELGATPGPHIGLALRVVKEAQVEGTVRTRAEALERAREFLNGASA